MKRLNCVNRLISVGLLLLLLPFVIAVPESPQRLQLFQRLMGGQDAITGSVVAQLNGTTNGTLSGMGEKFVDGDQQFLNDVHRKLVQDMDAKQRSSQLVQELSGANGDQKLLLKRVAREKIERFVIQLNTSCDTSDIPPIVIKREIVTEQYRFIVLMLPRNLLASLVDEECIVKIADDSKKEEFFAYARRILREESKARAKELRLDRSGHDITDYQNVIGIVETSWDTARGEYSPLQHYVVPTDETIVGRAVGRSPAELFALSLTWPWVSDLILWNESEHWTLPNAFILETPDELANPVPGVPVSDCSEKANTLVSLLRASGIGPKDVRVALGTVEFDDGRIGGHAWVELRVNDTWLVLDTTVGSYYDDTEQKLVNRTGLAFDYWKYHEFPVKDVWAYYNDQYFLDMKEKHAPSSWKESAGTTLDRELSDGLHASLWERIAFFIAKMVARFI